MNELSASAPSVSLIEPAMLCPSTSMLITAPTPMINPMIVRNVRTGFASKYPQCFFEVHHERSASMGSMVAAR